MSTTEKLTKKDFRSSQDVRWCPGCGDYSILNAVQSVFAELGFDRDKTVVVSGIGCSSRFPYYMETYGFHSIHGRAPAVAAGIKLANPELDVWIVTGDGDGLSIGGNHLIHTLRRNLGLKIMMFNNRIYGLTKGQYSPTSQPGSVTKSTPMGSLDRAFNPVSVAIGVGGTFVARSVDVMAGHLKATLKAAAMHKGTAFVEIFQNCNIFNDGAWEHMVERSIRDDRLIDLRPGQPLVYGKNHDKGLRQSGFHFEPMNLPEGEISEEVVVWRPEDVNPSLAFQLSQTPEDSEMPVPIGIFRDVAAEPFEKQVHEQIAEATERKGAGDIDQLIFSGDMWEVV